MIRIAGTALALALAGSLLLARTQDEGRFVAQNAGHFNAFAVQAAPLDVGRATASEMLWNGGNYGEDLRPASLSWSDSGRERPILVASFASGWAESRWLYVQLDKSREHAWIAGYVNTDFGQFPVTPLEGTELSATDEELRFRILARYQGAEHPETWNGVIAMPKDD